MPGTTPRSRGFTLVELAVTLTVLGLLLAFSVPAFQNINQSYQLKSTTETMAGTLRVWRERAIARGTETAVHYNNSVTGCDWHIHEYDATTHAQIGLIRGGKLPDGITTNTLNPLGPQFEKDGRVSTGAGDIIIQNRRGQRDTVSVLASGLILGQ